MLRTLDIEALPAAEPLLEAVGVLCSKRHGAADRPPAAAFESHGVGDATSEGADVSLNPGAATLTFPANTTGSAVTREVSGTILLQTNHDPDAEDETVVLAIAASGGLSIAAGSGTREEPLRTVTVADDETQSYVLALTPDAAPPGGGPVRRDGSRRPRPRGRQQDVDAPDRRNRLFAGHG